LDSATIFSIVTASSLVPSGLFSEAALMAARDGIQGPHRRRSGGGPVAGRRRAGGPPGAASGSLAGGLLAPSSDTADGVRVVVSTDSWTPVGRKPRALRRVHSLPITRHDYV
jgi:hypothetical protein